jgi:hypothetical protein
MVVGSDDDIERMPMRCPFCRSELSEPLRKRFKRAISLLAVLLVSFSLVWVAYWGLYVPNRVDLSHDVLFLMTNTLVPALFANDSGGPGGTLAVWGNISNDKGWAINPLVTIDINDSLSNMHFYAHAGLMNPGSSRYFSCAYSIDDLDLPSAAATVRVWGT